jgi:hypothetical protein
VVSIAIINLYILSMLRCCAIASTPNLPRKPHVAASKAQAMKDGRSFPISQRESQRPS